MPAPPKTVSTANRTRKRTGSTPVYSPRPPATPATTLRCRLRCRRRGGWYGGGGRDSAASPTGREGRRDIAASPTGREGGGDVAASPTGREGRRARRAPGRRGALRPAHH